MTRYLRAGDVSQVVKVNGASSRSWPDRADTQHDGKPIHPRVRRRHRSARRWLPWAASNTSGPCSAADFPDCRFPRRWRSSSSRSTEGCAVFVAAPGVEHYNAIGTVHAGYTATLLNSCDGLRRAFDAAERRRLHDDGIQGLAIAPDHEGYGTRPRRGHAIEPRPPRRDGRGSADGCAGKIAGSRDDDVPDFRILMQSSLGKGGADRLKLGLWIGEVLEAPAGLGIPITAVAVVAFDPVQAGMKPAEMRIRLVSLSDRVRAVPVAARAPDRWRASGRPCLPCEPILWRAARTPGTRRSRNPRRGDACGRRRSTCAYLRR